MSYKVIADGEEIEINSDTDLMVDENSVDSELAKMGHLLGYYGDILARLRAQYHRKEEDLEAVESTVDYKIRTSLPQGQKPFTETQIKKVIRINENYQKALDELAVCRLYYYRVDNLFKALVKKADAVNCLGYSQRKERGVY